MIVKENLIEYVHGFLGLDVCSIKKSSKNLEDPEA